MSDARKVANTGGHGATTEALVHRLKPKIGLERGLGMSLQSAAAFHRFHPGGFIVYPRPAPAGETDADESGAIDDCLTTI
jgi:hypothetical protein